MLTQVLAQELAPSTISVNELIPGPVVASLTGSQAEQRQGVFAIEGEWAKTPEEVVPLALFLATQPPIGPTAQSFSLMRRDTVHIRRVCHTRRPQLSLVWFIRTSTHRLRGILTDRGQITATSV